MAGLLARSHLHRQRQLTPKHTLLPDSTRATMTGLLKPPGCARSLSCGRVLHHMQPVCALTGACPIVLCQRQAHSCNPVHLTGAGVAPQMHHTQCTATWNGRARQHLATRQGSISSKCTAKQQLQCGWPPQGQSSQHNDFASQVMQRLRMLATTLHHRQCTQQPTVWLLHTRQSSYPVYANICQRP